jgi:DNA gyrase subunit A
MTCKRHAEAFIAFREEVVTRRTKFLLNKARDRAHVLVGLAIAVANIDEVIALIRTSPTRRGARAADGARLAGQGHRRAADRADRRSAPRIAPTAPTGCREQARAILDLRLQRLTALGRDEIGDELNELAAEIADYLDILRSRERISRHHPRRAARDQDRVRHAAPHRDRRRPAATSTTRT